MTILGEIILEKERETALRKREAPVESLLNQIASLAPPKSFAEALTRAPFPAVIAEIKRASPSRGVIRSGLVAVDVGSEYVNSGAACLSVLTEEKFFQGRLEELRALRQALLETPLLRKDFIIDPYQVAESRAWGADCILLIAAALDEVRLELLYREARKFALEVLVEVHNQSELGIALRFFEAVDDIADRLLLGVNNRDLKTFETSLEVSEELAALLKSSSFGMSALAERLVLVSESGIYSGNDLKRLRAAGFNAFLVGESLLASGAPGDNLARLIRAGRE